MNETYEGRELLMKMKKKTWWGKGENRRAGSIELDDDTQDEPGGLLQPPAFVNQRSSASFFFFCESEKFLYPAALVERTCFQVGGDEKDAAPYNKSLRIVSRRKVSSLESSPALSIHI